MSECQEPSVQFSSRPTNPNCRWPSLAVRCRLCACVKIMWSHDGGETRPEHSPHTVPVTSASALLTAETIVALPDNVHSLTRQACCCELAVAAAGHRQLKNTCTKVNARTGWAKLNGANAVSFVVVKHVLKNLANLAGEITVLLRTLRSIKLNTFRQKALQKPIIFCVVAF